VNTARTSPDLVGRTARRDGSGNRHHCARSFRPPQPSRPVLYPHRNACRKQLDLRDRLVHHHRLCRLRLGTAQLTDQLTRPGEYRVAQQISYWSVVSDPVEGGTDCEHQSGFDGEVGSSRFPIVAVTTSGVAQLIPRFCTLRGRRL
jgi:hypothetical protein